MTARHLEVVVCGAGPASDVGKLISAALADGWTVAVTATKAALEFIDKTEIEQATGHLVRTDYQKPGTIGRTVRSVDALIVAPATYNTVNKLALGIADSYPSISIAELIGRNVPTVIVPFVNSALAERKPFRRSVAALRSEGIHVTMGSEYGWVPHAPGSGSDRQADFPWQAAFDLVRRLTDVGSGLPRDQA